jgi:hypothetical protein
MEMRLRGILWVTTAALCCQAKAAPVQAAKEALVLKPTSKWVVDYENEGCQLARQFGDEPDRVIASFSRYAPGTGFKLVLNGAPLKQERAGEVILRFGPNEGEQELYFWPGTIGNETPSLIVTSTVWIAPAVVEKAARGQNALSVVDVYPKRDELREKAITYLWVGKPFDQPIQLELGSMDKAFGALDKCVDDLMASWGLDVQKHKNLKQAAYPIGNPGNWVNTSDYPIKMLQERKGAMVEFRLDVDEKGKAIGCHIQQTTMPKEFDKAVCGSLMSRSRFKPALDADSKPIRSYWKSTVRFAIPSY